MEKERKLPVHRRVSGRKKIGILAALALCAVLLALYKIPYEKTYTATLDLYEAGETDRFGGTVDVEVCVRVQRYFLKDATHRGRVIVSGVSYSNKDTPIDDAALSLFGILSDADTFTVTCTAFRGEYRLTSCVAVLENGEITRVLVRDENGVYAGAFGIPPEEE